MNKVTFDPAQPLDLYFRRGRNGSKTFSFFEDVDMTTPYDLEGLEFEFRSGFDVDLEINANEITIRIDEEELPRADTDFWELVCITLGRTWLCGTAYFTSSLPASVVNTENITILVDGEPVVIVINESNNSNGDVNGGTP